MAVIALVHGAWGVPEEWKGVAEALRALGHQGIAVDLPITDRHAGLGNQADAIAHAVAGGLARAGGRRRALGERVRGRARPLASARLPHRVPRAVVPQPGLAYAKPVGRSPMEATGDTELVAPAFRALIVDRGDGTCIIDPRGLALLMGASEEDADAMVPLLADVMRPHALRAFGEPWPEGALPDVPSSYLLSPPTRCSHRTRSASWPHALAWRRWCSKAWITART